MPRLIIFIAAGNFLATDAQGLLALQSAMRREGAAPRRGHFAGAARLEGLQH